MEYQRIKNEIKKYYFIKLIYKVVYRIYKEIIIFAKLIRYHIKNRFVAKNHLNRQSFKCLFEICDGTTSLHEFFDKNKLVYKEGMYVYYLPPQENDWLNANIGMYPEDSAIKIVKAPGNIESRNYIKSKKKPISQTILFPNAYELQYSNNYLSSIGITSRIYDVCKIKINNENYVAMPRE